MTAKTVQPFLGLSTPRGTVLRERVQVASFADGSAVTIPVVLVEGASEGPVVYIQAAIHGDEFAGTEACWQLAAALDPAQLAGRVVIVPVANTPAFLTRARGFLLEERFLQDGNRVFPGNLNGLLTERIVAHLLQGFVLHADLSIDLHCALDGSEIADFMHVGVKDNSDGHLALRQKLCHAFDMPYHFYRKPGMKLGTSDMSKSISSQGADAGKAVIMAEFAGSRSIDFDKATYAAGGLLRILRAMEMWQGQTPQGAGFSPEDFSNINMVHCDAGGGLRPLVKLGDRVKVGDALAEIVDIFGQKQQTVTAHVDGFVLRLMTYGAVASGAEVAWIGN